MSFMPQGLEPEIWDQGQSEKFFLGRIRHLPNSIEVLSSFGIGAPAARIHLGLAIEAGVKEVISVGTVGAINPNLEIGDLVLLNQGDLDQSILQQEAMPNVQTSTVLDIWENQSQQADVVEMEAEKLFDWCQKYDVKLSCLGVVSDLVRVKHWTPGFDKISNSLGRAHRIAYKALLGKGEK